MVDGAFIGICRSRQIVSHLLIRVKKLVIRGLLRYFIGVINQGDSSRGLR
jgi:hypothetical protein